MSIYKQDLFSDSESKMLKKLLKNPDDDYNKAISLFRRKQEEILKNLKFSEEKYRYLVINVHDIILEIDTNGIITYISPQVYDILGYTVEECIGQIGFDIVHPDDVAYVMKKIRDAIKTGDVFTYDHRVRHKKGYYIPISAKGALVKIDDNLRITGILRDISEQKEIERKLKESEEKYRHLFKEFPIGIFLFDGTGNLIEGNTEAYNSFSGYSTELSIGKNFTEIIHLFKNSEELQQIFKKRAVDRAKGKELKPIEIRLIRQDGKEIWIDWHSSTFQLDNKTFIQATVQDITDRKVTEQKLKESEEKYRSLIDALTRIGIGIDIIDLNFKILYQNKVLENRFGQTEGTLCYKTYLGLDESCDSCPMIKAIKINKIESAIIPTPDGKIYEVISAPLSNLDGIINRAAEVIIDITERKQAEENLKESEEKFRNIAEQSLMGICIIQDDVIKYINQALADLYGYSVEEMLNWDSGEFAKVVAPDSLDTVMEQVKKKQSGDPTQIIHYTIHCVKKSGELIWVDNISKTINYNGRPADLISQIDITERIIAKQELIELNKLKSDLIIRTSHELKTPLISIKGYTDLLLELHREKLETDTLSIIEEIHEGCERLEDLIINLLESSKLEADDIELQVSYEDLAFLIRFCVKDLRFWAKSRNHKISLEIHDSLMTMFEKERIYEVLNNLLGNAIKYTPPNGNIKIKSEIKDDFYIISVQDNGIGFTEDEKKKLFTQFGKIERYGRGWDVIIEGTGMGLYISKKIVELHGGKIWMESEGRNKGSTFYFTLPIEKG